MREKGSAAILAVLVLSVLGILSLGLSSLVTTQLRNTTISADVVEAQYVAEAGAKRAMVCFQHNLTTWAWADGATNNTFEDGTRKNYVVSISPSISDGATPIAGQLYKILADGTVGNVTKRVTVEVTMPASSLAGILPEYGGYIGAITSAKAITLNQPAVVSVASIPANVNKSGGKLEGDQNLSFPEYDYGKYKQDATLLPTIQMNQNHLNGYYYHDGDLTISQHNVTLVVDDKKDSGNGTTKDHAVIFVNGNIIFSGSPINVNDRIFFIATGSIVALSSPNLNQALLYAEDKDGGITFTQTAFGQPAVYVTPGALVFKRDVNWNTNQGQANQIVKDFNDAMEAYSKTSSSDDGSNLTIQNWSNK